MIRLKDEERVLLVVKKPENFNNTEKGENNGLARSILFFNIVYLHNHCIGCYSTMNLFPFQVKSRNWLLESRFRLLADQMRVGKTAPAVIATSLFPNKFTLIICPVIAVNVWKENIDHWVYHADRKKNYTIVTYDFARDHQEELMKKWDNLILDEAHKLKNPEALVTKAILGKSSIAKNCQNIYALTGTPMPNHPAELWTLLYVFGVTQMTYENFVRRYCEYYIYRKRECIIGLNHRRLDEFKKLLKPIMLRRTRVEVYPELPGEYYSKITIPEESLGKINISAEIKDKIKEEYALLKNVLSKIYPTYQAELKAFEAVVDALPTLRRILGLRKVKPVADIIIEELENRQYKKIVVFGIHTAVLLALFERLKKFNPVIIIGKTSEKDRTKAVQTFNNDSSCGILCGNVMAAGMAIDASIASEVLFIEKSWVSGDNEQASARCAGVKQKNKVHVRSAVANYLLDDKVTMVLDRKQSEILSVLN